MYLKSLKINNFRKFGEKNNVVEFVGSTDTLKSSKNTNIAPSTTLIVGKNNSGKTTVAEALKRLLGKSVKFLACDFNFDYLLGLLEEYKNNNFDRFPALEFEITVRIDINSECDLVTNIAPFLSIESVQAAGKENDFRVILRYEIEEMTSFKNEIESLLKKNHKEEAALFRKFLELIDETGFKVNYYNSEGIPIGENKFRINDLIEVKVINANKNINDTSLSSTFNKIIKFRYNLKSEQTLRDAVAAEIEQINKTIENKVSNSHTVSINTALSKIESSDHLEVSLRPDLTFEQILTNIIKYEYKEGKFHIPEGQFGLGYANLMTIIGELIDYIEQYPKQECHSKINLICIEEPEAFMHSQMQELFIKHINDAISYLLADSQKQINSQLIITTHSSHILNSKIHSGNSFNNISYIAIVNNFSNVVNLSDNNVMDGDSTSKLDDLKFLKKHIKHKVSELFFSDAVVFVEGVTEETLLSYYIEQREELKRYYISVFNINGAHGLVYHPLIKLLKVPNLIITDLDIKRTEEEKKDSEQISNLKGRITTNQTIIRYNSEKEKIENLKEYFENENIRVVFQREAVEGYFATSFEEAFILCNYNNDILNSVLASLKSELYGEIVGANKDRDRLKQASYKLQSGLSKSKSDFSNGLLYEMVVKDEKQNNPQLPKYINEGLDWLAKCVIDQLKSERQ